MKYGYMRVSTAFEQSRDRNQTFERQLMVLKENGVEEENIFKERISGSVSTNDRIEFEKLLQVIKPNDELIVSEMSRLSRSMQDLVCTVNKLIKMKVKINFLKEKIEFTNDERSDSMKKLMFNLLGAFAEFERSMIADRVSMGMQAAKLSGKKLGRNPKQIDKEQFKIDYQSGVEASELQEKYNISRATMFRFVKELGISKNIKRK